MKTTNTDKDNEIMTKNKAMAEVYLNLYMGCMKYKTDQKKEDINCADYYDLFEKMSIKYMDLKEKEQQK
jgi:hypothetical protein